MRFERELRELAAGLELPEPARSRMLLELRADLDAMAAALRERGLGEEEARRRALDALLPSSETVWELRRLHRPLWERLVARLSAPGRHRVERALVGAVVVVYLLAGGATLARFDLLESPSPFLWPVLLLAVVIGTAAVVALFRLFVLGVGGRRRRGLRLLPALGAATLVVAFGGAVTDLYALAGLVQADVARQLPLTLDWLRREAVLLSVALLAASTAGLAWIAAAARIAWTEQTETAALGYTPESRRRA